MSATFSTSLLESLCELPLHRLTYSGFDIDVACVHACTHNGCTYEGTALPEMRLTPTVWRSTYQQLHRLCSIVSSVSVGHYKCTEKHVPHALLSVRSLRAVDRHGKLPRRGGQSVL